MSKLQTIIEHAIEHGWNRREPNGAEIVDALTHYPLLEVCAYDIIFNHNFLKAVFGEEEMYYDIVWHEAKIPVWKMHAMKMVINQDPIEYVYSYVKERQDAEARRHPTINK